VSGVLVALSAGQVPLDSLDDIVLIAGAGSPKIVEGVGHDVDAACFDLRRVPLIVEISPGVRTHLGSKPSPMYMIMDLPFLGFVTLASRPQ